MADTDMESNRRKRARDLATIYSKRGNPLGWFEALYQEASAGGCEVPWADLKANPNLVEWLDKSQMEGNANDALVIGCGFGDDAEELSHSGFQVTAFDISATAISTCKKRFPETNVNYLVADLFAPPASWHTYFDFLLESYTLQVLPLEYRSRAIRTCCDFLRPGGQLLVISRGRDISENPGSMPWPLTRNELQAFLECGMREISFEDYIDNEVPSVRRFRALYQAQQRPDSYVQDDHP